MRPARWQTRTLGEVAELVGGGTPSRTRKDFFGSDIDWVTPTDLPAIGAVRTLGSVKEGLTREGLANSSAKELPPGSVLFSSRASIGKIAIADRPCCTNQGFASFIPHTDTIDSWFLAYYLAAKTPDISALAGETTFKEVSRSKLRSFPIKFPDLAEQRRIVARIKECLERIDEIRELWSEAMYEAKALLPSSLAVVFDELKAAREMTPINSVLSDSRYGTSRKCNAGEDEKDAVSVLRIPNVVDGQVTFSDLKYCKFEQKELERLVLEPGDLLVVRTNGSPELVGRCAVFEGGPRLFAFASYLIRLRIDPEKANPRFLAFFLTSTYGRDAIAAIRRTSAGQYNINSENLRSIQISLPSIEEQKRLADRLWEQQNVAREIGADQAARLDETEHLRAAVLRKAFSGEL